MVLPDRCVGGGEVDRSCVMALRVKCKCGKVLKIPSRLAGKVAACPQCKRKYRIPAEPDPQPSHLDLDLLAGMPVKSPSSTHGIELETNSAGDVEPPSAIAVDTEAPIKLGYARDQDKPTTRGNRLGDTIEGPKRSFWADALGSFIYPVRNVSNGVVCGFILIVSSVAVLLQFAGIFGLIGTFIINAWLAALYFSIIQDTASGSDDLPNLIGGNGMMDDLFLPSFKFIGAVAVVLGPAAILSICVGLGWVPASLRVMGIMWFVAGVFILPISLLLFAFDAPGAIFRLDLIITTVFRTLLPYLAMWLILLAVATFYGLTFLAPDLIEFKRPGSGGKLIETHIGVGFLLRMLGTFLALIAMRVIGLYYLHFKKRFAFDLE